MYVLPHSAGWADDFEVEVKRLTSAYRGKIRYYHIGSTSIPGLMAKDCIDILGIVSDLSEVTNARNKFESIGYDARGAYGIEGREYFSKAKRKAHLHIFEDGHPDALKHLHFVEVMKSTPALVDELNALKVALQAKYPDNKDAYQVEKEWFYDKVNKVFEG